MVVGMLASGSTLMIKGALRYEMLRRLIQGTPVIWRCAPQETFLRDVKLVT